MDMLWLVSTLSFHQGDFTTVMDCDMELWVKIDVLSPKLLCVETLITEM